MTAGRVIGEFADYAGMLAAVRARVDELNINGERFDEYAGLPRGYLSKLVGVNPQRRISMVSMGPLFSALGICCVVIEDAEATKRLKARLAPRNNAFHRTSYTMRTVTDRQWRKIQKLGRKARWKKLSKRERSEVMRAVSIARFGRHP